MSEPAQGRMQTIFDRALVRRRSSRALAHGPADFLLARTADDLVERLEGVQRRFARWADVGSPLPLAAERLAACRPDTGGCWLAPQAVPGRPQRAAYATVLGDVERLPLAPGRFDLVMSALALQSINDLPGALVQIRRSLRPDGLFLAALLGGRSLTELRDVLTQAEVEVTGGASPRVAPFADVRDMGGLLQRAGFALPVADSDPLVVRYDNLFALAADLRAMGATNSLSTRLMRPTRRAVFLRAADLYRQRFADADGRIRATFEVVSISGWAPHESQQKPAPRGSGTISLAAVLGDKAT